MQASSELDWREGTVRTNKLFCTKCGEFIRKGQIAVFGIDESGLMVEVYHLRCSPNDYTYYMNMHPFSSEALGQD